jgi:hypothetical protein
MWGWYYQSQLNLQEKKEKFFKIKKGDSKKTDRIHRLQKMEMHMLSTNVQRFLRDQRLLSL